MLLYNFNGILFSSKVNKEDIFSPSELFGLKGGTSLKLLQDTNVTKMAEPLKTTFGQLTIDQLTFGKRTIDQLTFGQLKFDQLTFSELKFDQRTLNKLTFDQLTF